MTIKVKVWKVLLFLVGLALLLLGILLLPRISRKSALSTPTPTSEFRITSATIKNKAGINPQPGMRPGTYYGPNPDSWWCVVPNCSHRSNPLKTIDHEMALIANLHIAVLRLEFDWPLIEPSQGRYQWSRADAIVLAADKYDVQLQPVLVYTPHWAGPSPNASPTSMQSWTNFTSRVVNRYKNSVHYWEMWNEPDGGGYWLSGPKEYVQNILVPGYLAVKATDPSAKVLLGAPYYADTRFLNDIYTYGGSNSFDIAGLHEYSNVLSRDGMQGDINAVRTVLGNKGQGSKPIWIGEYGYREPTNTTNDTGHITTMQIMLQQVTGYKEAIWYNLRDDFAMTCCPPKTVKVGRWGLVQHDDVTVKRGYDVMRRIIALDTNSSIPKRS